MAATRPAPKPRLTPTRSTRLSRRSLGIALAVAIVGTAALVAVALLARKSSTPPPVTTPPANLAGIPQTGRVLGSPKAKVRLIEYADPQCPACRYYAVNVVPAIVKSYLRTGRVKGEYRAFPFIGADSMRGARFLLAAGLQDRLWQLHDALYRAQGAENSGWLTDSLVRELGREIPGLDVPRLFRDARSARVAAMVGSDLAQVQALGLDGTPSLLLQIGSSAPYALSASVPLDAASLRQALDDALRS